jgi:hypothetical protein
MHDLRLPPLFEGDFHSYGIAFGIELTEVSGQPTGSIFKISAVEEDP